MNLSLDGVFCLTLLSKLQNFYFKTKAKLKHLVFKVQLLITNILPKKIMKATRISPSPPPPHNPLNEYIKWGYFR